MKTVVEIYSCDLCDKKVAEAKDLVNLRLAGHGVAEAKHDICWDCVHSYAEWKSNRRSGR